jgi:hypothetical protein
MTESGKKSFPIVQYDAKLLAHRSSDLLGMLLAHLTVLLTILLPLNDHFCQT